MSKKITTANEPTPEPLIDAQRLLAGLRRRRRLWLSLTLAGLFAGMALAVVMPTPPTAVTRLLIVHQNDQPSDGGSLMETDIALLQTRRIAEAALQRIGSSESPNRFLNQIEATGLTSNVMELRVTGSSEQDALAKAKAVSEAFLADYKRRIQQAADAESKALVDQQAKLRRDLAEVDRAIEAGSSPAELETLYGRRSELSSQISDLGSQAEEAGVGTPSVTASTEIADTPFIDGTSLLRTVVINGALGAVVGLVVGLSLAVIGAVIRDRPVLRRDISTHLGASVIAQLPARHRGPTQLWRRSHAVAETRQAAATLVRTVPDAPAEVSLLALGCQRQTAELAMDMAAQLAERGQVMVIDAMPDNCLSTQELAEDSPIRVVDIADYGTRAQGLSGERHIGVGSVEPGTPWTDLSQLGPETILVVRAGYAETVWLHTVARQLADTRIPIIGVVLVDPDPKDRSDGTLWNGLHTALRGRSGRPASRNGAAGQPRAARVRTNGEHPTERMEPVWPTESAAVEVQ